MVDAQAGRKVSGGQTLRGWDVGELVTKVTARPKKH